MKKILKSIAEAKKMKTVFSEKYKNRFIWLFPDEPIFTSQKIQNDIKIFYILINMRALNIEDFKNCD